MIKASSYHASLSGPHVLITGAVHGDEICGPAAIQKAAQAIETGKIRLKKGCVTFLPVCNPEAYKKKVRYVDRNLNRFLEPKASPVCYEDFCANSLCPYLEKADVLLDLHSFAMPGEAFIFMGNPQEADKNFVAALGLHKIIYGWQDAYGALSGEDPATSTGTTEYARKFGALAVTLECGQHHDKNAPKVAYRAIINTLAHTGVAHASRVTCVKSKPLLYINLKRFWRRGEGSFFRKNWRHFDPVCKGETLICCRGRKVIEAPDDGFVILPREDAQEGEEWLYFGTDSPDPPGTQ